MSDQAHLPFSPNVVPDPQKDAGITSDREVDGAIGSGDETIVIDTKTGHVKRENPDGSMTIEPLGKPARKPRGAAKFDDNLAEDLDPAILATIANRLLDRIDADIRSRSDWEATAQKGAGMLGVKLEEASAEIGIDGMISRVKHTGLLQACIVSWANSRAELLPVGGPVKIRDDSVTEDEEVATDGIPGMGHNGGPALDGADLTNVLPGPGAPSPFGAPPPPQPLPPQLGGGGITAGAPPAPPPITPPSKATKRDALADAFEHDFNHYLTKIDKDYYPDTSRMFMSRGLLGCQFKKVYHDPILRRPVSRWVKGTDLIVSNEATSLSSAARITERIPMRQSTAKRYQAIGMWRDVPLVQPSTENTPMEKKIGDVEGVDPRPQLPEDELHTIYECYTELDEDLLGKDETGKQMKFPLPYRITLDKYSRVVVEIRRNWKRGDDRYIARRRYVKFGHVPGLGFYDWGLVHLIGNPQRAATMIEQILMDAGMLNSFPGGIMAKSPGSRQRTTEVRPAPGEWLVMDTGGMPVSDFAMPMPYKEPSSVLAALGTDLASQMKQVAGVVELPVGEGRIGNTPVGTIMAYVDAVTKVPSAVHKDDHIAQQEEFEMLRDLFAEDPKSLWAGNPKPMHKWAVAHELADQDLVPAADPNVPSQTHRLMKANMRVQMAGLPQFAGIPNQRAIWEDTMRIIGSSNTGEFTNPQTPAAPAPPPPQVIAAQIRAGSQEKSDQAKLLIHEKDHQARQEELAVTSADKAADRDSETERALLKHKTETGSQHTDLLKHGITTAVNHRQHKDGLGIQGHEMAQDHVQHLNEIDQANQDRLAAAAEPTQPDTGAQP